MLPTGYNPVLIEFKRLLKSLREGSEEISGTILIHPDDWEKLKEGLEREGYNINRCIDRLNERYGINLRITNGVPKGSFNKGL